MDNFHNFNTPMLNIDDLHQKDQEKTRTSWNLGARSVCSNIIYCFFELSSRESYRESSTNECTPTMNRQPDFHREDL